MTFLAEVSLTQAPKSLTVMFLSRRLEWSIGCERKRRQGV
jgi:hypothetical protein